MIRQKIFLVLSFTFILFSFPSCTFLKLAWYNFSDIEDYKIFASRKLSAGQEAYRFYESGSPRVPQKINFSGTAGVQLDSLLKCNNTTAFLVIKNDTLLYEKYFNEYADTSLSLAFSMTKSFFSILVGCAIEGGYIKSVEDRVTEYVPELKANGFEKVKIKHLLQMTSGMDYNDSDSPFSVHPYFYYTDNLEDKLLGLELEKEPGIEHIYKSGEVQLLGLILKRALKTKSITEYMEERIWQPVGMEFDGLWSLDHKDGLEKVYCCIAARARDYAKLGRLYLNYGNWNGRQIVPHDWVEQSTKIDTTEGSVWYYQYYWWLVSKERGDYMAIGHLGQFLYINPKDNMVIVRLGKDMGDISREEWKDIFTFISENVD